jgi:hypothetical protein
VALAAPALCWVVDVNQAQLFGRWQIGLELLVLNGLLTFLGLVCISRRQAAPASTGLQQQPTG